MTKEQLTKLQCVHLQHRVENLAFVFTEHFEEIVLRLVEEGKTINKTPWCADIYCEMEANKRLNLLGNYPQEEMNETVRRRNG